MFQDNEILKEIHSLPPEKQAEVVDFIQFLKSKQTSHNEQEQNESNLIQKASALLLSADSKDDLALWDAVVDSPDEPFQCEEPQLLNP